MTPLTLTFSPCPNDTFVFHAWVHGLLDADPPADVSYHDVDVANGMAERRERDVVKVSYAALPWLLDDYALLPCGGAVGRGCGPLVVTTGRTDLSGASVVVPGERTTAYLLFRLWAAGLDLRSVDVLPFEQIMPAVQTGRFDAGLVIHEARFTYPSYGLTAVADLGDWWESETSLPVPLGAIVAKRRHDAAGVADVVRASVEHAWSAPSETRPYVMEHAQEMDPAVADAHIALYVNEFTRDLGDEGYAAAETLLDRAVRAGLVPTLPQPLR